MATPETYAFRLHPGQDLKKEIESIVRSNNVLAGWIVTAVGSLTEYNIRFANRPTGDIGRGHFEIVSLTGTLSLDGCHIHISISDETGRTIGGHLLEGCKIYTTAEIVIAATDQYEFKREQDEDTGWKELVIS
ncbi:MAG: PPC domain-containing DNA-binding protein [Chitinophagaceae bacterium]